MRTVRVLLIDNSKGNIRKFKEALAFKMYDPVKYELTVSESREGGLKKTLLHKYDLIVFGPMRQPFPNFTFATDMHYAGKKVLIVNDRRTHFDIPFLSYQGLNKDRILEAMGKIV